MKATYVIGPKIARINTQYAIVEIEYNPFHVSEKLKSSNSSRSIYFFASNQMIKNNKIESNV